MKSKRIFVDLIVLEGLTIALGFVSGTAANQIPDYLKPYLSFPTFIGVAGILLLIHGWRWYKADKITESTPIIHPDNVLNSTEPQTNSVLQPNPETPDAISQKTRFRKPKQPNKSEGLDTKILQILYAYQQQYPGNYKMSFNELVKDTKADQKDIVKNLFELQHKEWVKYDLADKGESGLVWLTPLGIRVAQDAQ